MKAFRNIAEKRIRDAMDAGMFDNLAGAGRPLRMEDESWIPEDLRSAYRVLKNAGCVPPEVALRKEITTLADLMDTLDDETERIRSFRRIQYKLLELAETRRRPVNLEAFPDYEARLYARLSDP